MDLAGTGASVCCTSHSRPHRKEEWMRPRHPCAVTAIHRLSLPGLPSREGWGPAVPPAWCSPWLSGRMGVLEDCHRKCGNKAD